MASTAPRERWDRATMTSVRVRLALLSMTLLLVFLGIRFLERPYDAVASARHLRSAPSARVIAERGCLSAFSSFSNGSSPGQPIDDVSAITSTMVEVVSEYRVRGGWLVTLVNRPTSTGYLCDMEGATAVVSMPMPQIARHQSLAVETVYNDNNPRTNVFGFFIHAHRNVARVRLVMASGHTATVQLRDGIATALVARHEHRFVNNSQPVGELIGFNARGEVVALDPLTL